MASKLRMILVQTLDLAGTDPVVTETFIVDRVVQLQINKLLDNAVSQGLAFHASDESRGMEEMDDVDPETDNP